MANFGSAFIVALLALLPNSRAETPTARTAQGLRIIPLAGNNEFNDIEHQVMAPLAVQVLDQNDLPVEGAVVLFEFPDSGPSAMFGNSTTFQTFRTGRSGQVLASGWISNNQAGTLIVRVTAFSGNKHGTISISMTNATPAILAEQAKRKRWWLF